MKRCMRWAGVEPAWKGLCGGVGMGPSYTGLGTIAGTLGTMALLASSAASYLSRLTDPASGEHSGF